MLVTFFKRGSVKNLQTNSGGHGAKNYLLGKNFDNGTTRDGATLMRGNPVVTTEVINSLNFSKIYTSGCLSFDEDESKRVTEDMKHEMMESFEKTLFPEFDINRTSGYWVEHTDKNRLELNFVFANVDLVTGKALTVYLHKLDKNRVNCWKDLINTEFGLSDPNASHRKCLTRITNRLPSDVKELKIAVNDLLSETLLSGELNSRADVINLFKSQDFKIVRESKNSLSIKNPFDDRRPNIRFQGAYYEQEFKSASYIAEAKTASEPTKTDKRARSDELSIEYERLCRKRTERLKTRFADNVIQTESTDDKRNESSIQDGNQLYSYTEKSTYRTERELNLSVATDESEPYSTNQFSERNAESSTINGVGDITNNCNSVDSASIQSQAVTNIASSSISISWSNYLRSLSTPYQPRRKRGIKNESDRTFKYSFDSNRGRHSKINSAIIDEDSRAEFIKLQQLEAKYKRMAIRERQTTDSNLDWFRGNATDLRKITTDYQQAERNYRKLSKTTESMREINQQVADTSERLGITIDKLKRRNKEITDMSSVTESGVELLKKPAQEAVTDIAEKVKVSESVDKFQTVSKFKPRRL